MTTRTKLTALTARQRRPDVAFVRTGRNQWDTL